MTTKDFSPATGLSDAAKCVCAGWFANMRAGSGELTFSLGKSKPREWVVEALMELLRAGVISVRPFNGYGGLVFTPLLDCRWAFEWMLKGGGKKTKEAKLPLTEPIKSVREGQKFQRWFLAQGIDARSGETERLGPKGESPVPKGCAQ